MSTLVEEEGYEVHKNCGGIIRLSGDWFRCDRCRLVCTTEDTTWVKGTRPARDALAVQELLGDPYLPPKKKRS